MTLAVGEREEDLKDEGLERETPLDVRAGRPALHAPWRIVSN
jgi:hypothetical protein